MTATPRSKLIFTCRSANLLPDGGQTCPAWDEFHLGATRNAENNGFCSNASTGPGGRSFERPHDLKRALRQYIPPTGTPRPNTTLSHLSRGLPELSTLHGMAQTRLGTSSNPCRGCIVRSATATFFPRRCMGHDRPIESMFWHTGPSYGGATAHIPYDPPPAPTMHGFDVPNYPSLPLAFVDVEKSPNHSGGIRCQLMHKVVAPLPLT